METIPYKGCFVADTCGLVNIEGDTSSSKMPSAFLSPEPDKEQRPVWDLSLIHIFNAAIIVKALGGADNIKKVDNCYTRLRLILENPDLVDENVLKQDTGANAVVKKGNNVQVIYGLKVTAVRKAVDTELGFGLSLIHI